MQTDKEKAEEILKKRELAAKGLKPRSDGKPVDPLEDAGSLDVDQDPEEPLTPEEKQKRIGDRGLAAGLGLKR